MTNREISEQIVTRTRDLFNDTIAQFSADPNAPVSVYHADTREWLTLAECLARRNSLNEFLANNPNR